MLRAKWTKLMVCLCRRPRLYLFLLPCVLITLTFYIVSGRELELENLFSFRAYNNDASEDDIMDGYLVWNPKCHMLSMNPMDSSIKKFVNREKFEACSSTPLMSHVIRDPLNGSIAIVINEQVAKSRNNPTCCWTPIARPTPSRPPKGDWDTKISVGKCEDFVKRVNVPPEVEIVMIKCRKGKSTIYENIHAIINPMKVQDRLEAARARDTNESLLSSSSLTYRESSSSSFPPFDNDDGSDDVATTRRSTGMRKLSVLILGIDSVSRLNFKRSLPKTEKLLRDDDNWYHLRGYNKMGENTFPNIMAILTGMESTDAYSLCKPTIAYGLDNCPMLWYNYRNANYVTAYGEDVTSLSTFNYRKVGFVDPPTDYYLRPYIQSAEKLLKSKKRFNHKYCTGPVSTVERVFNYATDYARTFMGVPYFGFFWTNSLSHDDMNGVSSMDERFYDMFVGMERDGTMNDTMLIFLSDHGMRWGGIRNTFVGWYEERLPFIYVRLPDWFSNEEPTAIEALRVNQNRLTSPYDLYETLRDILIRSGASENVDDPELTSTAGRKSKGCPKCQSLFRPIPQERGCEDAGISSHWCTCTAFKPSSTTDKIAIEGTRRFLDHIENTIKNYKNKKGKRLCARLRLNKIIRVEEVVDVNDGIANPTVQGYFYLIEVKPGGGRYEVTIRYHGDDNFTINEDEVSRVNSYASSSTCLEHGSKRYCHCINGK